MEIGQFLKTCREQHAWTQPEAAEKIGIEQSYLSKLENNKASLSNDIYQKLKHAYSFDEQSLFNEVSDKAVQSLLDIEQVRSFYSKQQQGQLHAYRRWLAVGLIALCFGFAVTTFALFKHIEPDLYFVYESKGEIFNGESEQLFVEFPTYHEYTTNSNLYMEGKKEGPLFPRLQYKQHILNEYKGNYYNITGTDSFRHYRLVGQRRINHWQSVTPYLTSMGIFFVVFGLTCFYLARRWK